MTYSENASNLNFHTSNSRGREQAPPWAGYWRVRRYGGSVPSVPTYYDATPESWDVIKRPDEDPNEDGAGLHVARHPILEVRAGTEVRAETIVLKDEGASDEEAETWRVETDGETVRVVAQTGPHEGAVGIAVRIPADPREQAFQRKTSQ